MFHRDVDKASMLLALTYKSKEGILENAKQCIYHIINHDKSVRLPEIVHNVKLKAI